MSATIKQGPHVSAFESDAMAQLHEEVKEKEARGQVRVVKWESIRDNPPQELKVSPIAMIPHKSRKYRAILYLSFECRLSNNKHIASVNATTVKTAPRGACDQMGHSLLRVIHAFAEADEKMPDAKIFSAKWDVKDGFWRLVCEEGEEWNFAYVLPQKEGEPVKLVIPTSLQMGWIESPPYFCAASETARDVAEQYVETPVGTTAEHKFQAHTRGSNEYEGLPSRSDGECFRYMIEVYVDDFIALAIAISKDQLDYVAGGVMHGIYDAILPSDDKDDDTISMKKLTKQEGT